MARKNRLSAVCLAAGRMRLDQRGVVLALFALAISALLMVVGLAVDVGWWYALQRQDQSGADAAALSAAYEYANNPASDLTSAASQAAALNKYNGNTPDVTLDAVAGTVQAVLHRPQATWFSSLANLRRVTITTGAVAKVTPLAPGCIIALSKTATYGIYVQGSAVISAPDCALVSDSSSSQSVYLHDNGVSITAATVITAGEVAGHVNSSTFDVTYPAEVGAQSVSDPYASRLTHTALTAGMPTAACILNTVTNTWSSNCVVIANCPRNNPPSNCLVDGQNFSGSTRISGDWTPGVAVTLPAGTYWITDGDLTVKNATLSCSGCTIIMTTATNTKIGYVSTSANGNLSLIEPTSGTFGGVVLVQDFVSGVTIDTVRCPNDPKGLCLNANSPASLNGLVYFPKSDIGFQGGPSAAGPACLLVVGNTVQMSGDPTLETSGCPSALGLPKVQTVALVQ